MSTSLIDDAFEAVVAKHVLLVIGAADAYTQEAQQREKVATILALLEVDGVFPSSINNHNHGTVFSLEAMLLIYDLFATIDHGWRGGSLPGKTPNIDRGRQAAHRQLIQDYFSGQDSTYPDSKFRRRFRMRKDLFLHIVGKLEQEDPYFQQKPDATGKLGASALQKVTAALRLLAYGGCPSAVVTRYEVVKILLK